MKKMFFIAVYIPLSVYCFAQQNNPYNQRGIDFTNSINLIKTDYYSGKVTEFNSASIANYSAKVPLQNQADINIATSVINGIKKPGLRIDSLIYKSSLSPLSKQVLITISLNPQKFTYDIYRNYLVTKTNEIKLTKMITSEKEFLLSMVAIAYNNAVQDSRKANCYIQGTDNGGPASCVVVGAVIGGTIGVGICGVLCGFGGAIIGGVLGAVS